MVLWIRTQDKSALIKSKGLYLYSTCDENSKKKAQAEHDNIMSKAYNFGSTEKAEAKAREIKNEYLKKGKIHTYIKDNMTNLILGEYKTKERALEVLDEIQIKLTQQSVGQSVFVYEMPKE